MKRSTKTCAGNARGSIQCDECTRNWKVTHEYLDGSIQRLCRRCHRIIIDKDYHGIATDWYWPRQCSYRWFREEDRHAA